MMTSLYRNPPGLSDWLLFGVEESLAGNSQSRTIDGFLPIYIISREFFRWKLNMSSSEERVQRAMRGFFKSGYRF